MTTTRSLPAVSPGSPAPARPRAADRDEAVTVADLLPPGATRLPAPPSAVPVLPGRPPMVGCPVLVPAGHRPPLPAAAPEPDGHPADHPVVRVGPVRRTAEVDGRRLDLT